MTAPRAALAVFDDSPIVEGGDASRALRESLELAVAAERTGYSRYWLAEHHASPSIAGSAPHVLAAAVAAATSTIRVGTAATIVANYAPLQIAESIGVLEALHPGRIDLGLGRSGSLVFDDSPDSWDPAEQVPEEGGVLFPLQPPPGLRWHRAPAAPGPARPRLTRDGTPYAQAVDEILALFDPESETHPPVPPARGTRAQVWVHGTSAGESAEVAARLGLRFGASYRSAGTLREAIAHYRRRFVPSPALERPYVAVSVELVVGEDPDHAEWIGRGYDEWVLGIRGGDVARRLRAPDSPPRTWTSEEQALVRDRLLTRIVGDASSVVDRLDRLQRVTGADEFVVNTLTYSPRERIRSYERLAAAWSPQEPPQGDAARRVAPDARVASLAQR